MRKKIKRKDEQLGTVKMGIKLMHYGERVFASDLFSIGFRFNEIELGVDALLLQKNLITHDFFYLLIFNPFPSKISIHSSLTNFLFSL